MGYPGKPDELTTLSPQRTVELLHAAIGDDSVAIDLIECNAWEAAFGIAAAFRGGRVFLAGDAAHVQSSAGGLGMNTGIQDGHNLAWKLAAVLRGRAGRSLLDTYDPERRAAARASLALSRGMHHGYRTNADAGAWYADVAADYLRGMLWYRYDSTAVCADQGSGADHFGDRAAPGYRLPHRWLTDGPRRVSTLDLLDPGWTLLTGPEGQVWSSAAARAGLRVQPITPELTDGDTSAFSEMGGIEPDGAVLVRPDQFVAWRTSTARGSVVDTFPRVVDGLLGRADSPP